MKFVKRITPNVKSLNVKVDVWNCANLQHKP